MIIFDLDTLADCEHRRHFVDPQKDKSGNVEWYKEGNNPIQWVWTDGEKKGQDWLPDWQSFYESCDQDKPIEPVINIFRKQMNYSNKIDQMGWQIWSGRCESVRDKTIKWLNENIYTMFLLESWQECLKMRPIGDNTPDDQLKERWLNECCADLMEDALYGKIPKKHNIDFVFDSDPESIAMWRRRGIFVFNCGQSL